MEGHAHADQNDQHPKYWKRTERLDLAEPDCGSGHDRPENAEADKGDRLDHAARFGRHIALAAPAGNHVAFAFAFPLLIQLHKLKLRPDIVKLRGIRRDIRILKNSPFGRLEFVMRENAIPTELIQFLQFVGDAHCRIG